MIYTCDKYACILTGDTVFKIAVGFVDIVWVQVCGALWFSFWRYVNCTVCVWFVMFTEIVTSIY